MPRSRRARSAPRHTSRQRRSHESYNALATLYFKDIARYGPDVEALYLRGVEAYPADRDMWNNLGYLYTQRAQWSQASAAYEKALQIDPQFELARRNLAVVLQKIGPPH